MKPINVGLLGLGTVGGGTLTVLRRNAGEITRRAGREIRVTMAAVRDLDKARKLAGSIALSPNSLPKGERDAGSLCEFHIKEEAEK